MLSPPVLETCASPVPRADSAYWTLHAAVAAGLLADWLPTQPARVLDLSGCQPFSAQLLAAGHEVVHVGTRPPVRVGPGRLLAVTADARSLGWLTDAISRWLWPAAVPSRGLRLSPLEACGCPL